MQSQPPFKATGVTPVGYVPLRREVAKRRRRIPVEKLMVHVGLLCVCCGFLMPFVWMLSTSLKTLDRTMAFPPQFIPNPVQPINYWKVITHEKFDFPLFARNTLIIASLAVTGTVISSAVVAYGFAKIRFRGRGVLFSSQ